MATAKWEHLTCEYEPKPHKWKRELGQRGRKPRFCPKHKPTVSVNIGPAGPRTLHCELGNHDWIREPKRGRVPINCPEHQPDKPATLPKVNGKVTLHCEIGNHDWEREPKRGRKPTSCPAHSVPAVGPRSVPVNVIAGTETGDALPEKRKRGRPRKFAEDVEPTEAQKELSRQRVDRLEGMLKDRGTHISQQAPYILYRKVAEKPGRNGTAPTTTWERVEEHSPLTMAQYVNKHEVDFIAGKYRYERDGKVINIL